MVYSDSLADYSDYVLIYSDSRQNYSDYPKIYSEPLNSTAILSQFTAPISRKG